MHEHQEDQKTILLVEDEALIAVMEKQILNRHGFNVVLASNGEKAIEAVNTNPNIDLILMDINLGKGMDGTEAAETILKEKDIPILFLSSYTQPEVVQKTEKISSYGYVTKDSGETVLITSIKMAFKLFEAHLELKEKEQTYRSLVERLPDIVMRFDRDGRHLFVSENVSEVVDFQAAQFIGKTHREVGFPEAQCQFWEDAIRRVFDSGATFESEFTFESKNGPAIHNWRLMLERDAQGTVSSVLSLSRDITARRKAEHDYQMLFHEMLDGFALHEIICDVQGNPVDYRFLAMNPSFERMTGLKADNIVGRTVLDVLPGIERYWIESYGRVALTGEAAFFENYSKDLDKYFEVKTFRSAPNQFACIFYNITERKEEERTHLASIELLRMINATSSKDELIQSMTAFLKQWLHCDAIGIRLKDGDDFPYYETSGFPEEFVQAERYLCSYDSEGEVIRDYTGSPVLDCMCGNILCGKFDPAKNFFTPHGSFWSNCTTELLASTTEADRQARTRNRCNGEGYESVGLFPLRLGSETFGVLQVNDKQKGLFTSKRLSFLEWFGENLAIALAHLLAEEKLQESEERFRTVVSSANDGVILQDNTGKILTWNKAAESVFGVDSKEIVGQIAANNNWKTYREDGTPFPGSEHPSMYTLATGKPCLNAIMKVVRATNDFSWININTNPIFKEGESKPSAVAITFSDITENKQMEDFLRESEEQFRTLATLAPVGIYLTDPDGNCLYANPAWCKMAGLSLEEAHGQGWARGLHPDDRPFILTSWQQMVESQGQWGLEYRFQTREGIITTVYGLGAPQYDASGKIVRYVGVNLDITERKQAEKVIRYSEEKFSKVFEKSPILMTISSPEDGTYLDVNEKFTEVSGFKKEEAIGKTSVELGWIQPKDRELLIHELKMKGHVGGMELELESKEKRKITCLFYGEVINVGGKQRLLSIAQDITDRKLAEDKIKSLLAEKELLLREVHHRIKNHMNVIMSLLSLQSSTMGDNPSAVAALEDSRSRVQSMMVLYDRLYRSGDFRTISTKEYLTTLVDEIIGNFPRRVRVVFETQIDDVSLSTKTLSPLGIIINELITNIMKHAFIGRDDGLVHMSFLFKDNHATLSIADNGIGIAESIDSRFSTGFGLQLVDILTKQLEGTIRLEHKNGTTFILEFGV